MTVSWSESIVEKVPVRAIEVGFGGRQTRLSNGSGCVHARQARQAGHAMKHVMQHTLAAGAADSVESKLGSVKTKVVSR